MTKQHIRIGDVANDRTGDPLREAFRKVNENFDELYANITDRLVNGEAEVVLDEIGTLTVPGTIALPNGIITSNDNTDPGMVLGSSDNSVFVRTLDGVNTNTWKFGTDGVLTLPGGTILDSYLVKPVTDSTYVIRTRMTGVGNKDWQFGIDGKLTLPDGGVINNFDGSAYGAGISISDFGEGFSLTAANKVVTNKLYSTNLTQPTQHYRLELDTNGVVHLPDQSVINGATLKSVAGNYAGITAGPVGKDEDSWVWVDSTGAFIATNYSTSAKQWSFDNTGVLTLPEGGDIRNINGTSVLGGTGGASILNDLTDVQTTIPLSDGQFLRYNGNNSTWENWTVSFVTGTPWTNEGYITLETDGTLTLPGAVVNSTVAKTGAANFGQSQVLTVTTTPSNDPSNWSNAGPYPDPAIISISGTNVTCSIYIGENGDLTLTVTDSTYGTVSVGNTGILDGTFTNQWGSVTFTEVTVTVATVSAPVVATAIDLTKSINKLTDGEYTLANGVEGQIMYLVRQNGSTAANISVQVAAGRQDGTVYSDQSYQPFLAFTDIATVIFTDNAWQTTGQPAI